MKKLLMPVAACILILAGCSGEKIPELKGNEYKRTEDGVEITLRFDGTENKITGKVVNSYFGTYEKKKDKIKFGPIASTMMMGPEAAMKVERSYFKFLKEVDSLSGSENTVVLQSKTGEKKEFGRR